MAWTKEQKEHHMYRFAVVSFTVGVILIFTGLLMPPMGEIDANVLIATGEFLSFAGALLGINMHYDNELQQFKHRVMDTIEHEERIRNSHRADDMHDDDVLQDDEDIPEGTDNRS